MQGNPKIMEALADLLAAELSASSTYFVHAKMRDNWGYPDLAKRAYDDSIEEMRHAEKLIERIIYFEKTPNLQRLNRIRVGDGVTLIGRQGQEAIWADEIAGWTGTIPYETLCAIGSRIPRLYTHSK